jgi:hypothetical protein
MKESALDRILRHKVAIQKLTAELKREAESCKKAERELAHKMGFKFSGERIPQSVQNVLDVCVREHAQNLIKPEQKER